MKFNQFSAAFLALAAAYAANASASTITYETRSVGLTRPADYAAKWDSLSSTVTSVSLVDFKGTTPANSTIAHLDIDFTVGAPVNALFQLAPDAGYGGALYLDGKLIDFDSNDLWWGGNWLKIDQLLTSGSLALTSGVHELEAFWIEDCCSGAQSGRYSLDGGASWKSLSVANLDQLAVPEPSVLALLGIGFAGLGFSRRKSSK